MLKCVHQYVDNERNILCIPKSKSVLEKTVKIYITFHVIIVVF